MVHLGATASRWLKFFAESNGLESPARGGNSPVDIKQKKPAQSRVSRDTRNLVRRWEDHLPRLNTPE